MYYFNKFDDIISWRTLPDGSWNVDKTVITTPLLKPYWFDYLIRPSQLLTKVRTRFSNNLSGELGPNRQLADTYDQRGLIIFRENLRLLKSAASLFGAKLFVAKQATLITADLPVEERKRCNYEYHGFSHEAHVDAFRQIYRIIEEEIEPEYIIDVTSISGTPEFFYDHIHPTELGAKKIAEIVSTALLPHILANNTAK